MKTCPNCRRMFSDSVTTCTKCGASLAAPNAAPTHTPPAQSASQPTYTAPAQPASQPTYTAPAQSASQPTYTAPAQSVSQSTVTPPVSKKNGGKLKKILISLLVFCISFAAAYYTEYGVKTKAPVTPTPTPISGFVPVSSTPTPVPAGNKSSGTYEMAAFTTLTKLSDMDVIEQVQVWFGNSATGGVTAGPAAFEIGFSASNFKASSSSRLSVPKSWGVYLGKSDGTFVELGTVDGGNSWGANVTSEEMRDYEAVLIVPEENFRGSFDYTVKIDGVKVPVVDRVYLD